MAAETTDPESLISLAISVGTVAVISGLTLSVVPAQIPDC